MERNKRTSARKPKWHSLHEDCFLDLKQLSARTCIGIGTLRDHIKSPSHPLPCYKVKGKILVNWIEFKGWANLTEEVTHNNISSGKNKSIIIAPIRCYRDGDITICKIT